LIELFGSGEYTTAELGDLFGVARSTVYRAVERSKRPKIGARTPEQTVTAPTRAADAQAGPLHDQHSADALVIVYRPRHGAPGELPSPTGREPRQKARPVKAPATAK
jgi:hypothetical protein